MPPTPDMPAGMTAGMSSEFRSRSVRGQVPALDPSMAADYNLRLKLGHTTPRAPTLAPWLGGGERLPPAAPAPLTDASNRPNGGPPPLSLHAGFDGAPSSGISTLSHAEKLHRMRELRQGLDSPRR